jgi:hypothetical protein
MGFLRNLRLWLSPLRMADPDFGPLVFMHISKWPERSYWEAQWKFPATGTEVGISLRGDESGPTPESRLFYLSLLPRFDSILTACRPKLERVFQEWRKQELPQDLFSVLKLTGFGLEDPLEQPVRWDVWFETTDDDWLGITIPFAGESPQDAVVDT